MERSKTALRRLRGKRRTKGVVFVVSVQSQRRTVKERGRFKRIVAEDSTHAFFFLPVGSESLPVPQDVKTCLLVT